MGSDRLRLERWHEVWTRRAEAAPAARSLEELLAVDGYDTAASAVGPEVWRDYVGRIQRRLDLQAGRRVCEIGCGAGAFLLPLHELGVAVSGVDYAEGLVHLCRAAMPLGLFDTAEARSVPFPDRSFDAVVSSGVFLYFPDLDYAETVVDEARRLLVPGGRAALLDVPDAAREVEYLELKARAIGEAEYRRLYAGHTHQFYERSWFERLAASRGLACAIEDQAIPGYVNGPFRFNVFLADSSS